MRNTGKYLAGLLFALFCMAPVRISGNEIADSVKLYTAFSRITVSPGESVNYSVDIINKSGEIKNLNLSVTGIPRDWKYTLKAGTWNIQQISVLPNEKQIVQLTVEVPLKVNKGTFRFTVTAGDDVSLPLAISVAEKGTFETAFTTQQANMEGHSKAAFTFNTSLFNRTAEKQLYALKAVAPRGWTVLFKPNYIQATSVEVDPNASKDIQVEVKPPESVSTGTYLIPVSAVTGATSASLNLEVVITGSYDIELATPTGMVSTGITSGDQKKIELLVRNTGTSALTDVNLQSSAPINWEITFDPKKIDRIEPGANATVTATVKAAKRALAGDYVSNIEAKTPEVSSTLSFRFSVRTPMLLGWLGILIILVAAGSVYYLFRKYGRR